MSVTPDISVVMSVYNGAEYLRETCDSVLSQEGVNLEFIVIDDGSTDASGQILRKYANNDSRVIVIENDNQGLTLSLIQGCLKATGRYIARQDVGDLSFPKRLFLQKAALDADEDLAFVSSWTEYCGPQREFLYLVKGTGRAPLPVFIISEEEKHVVIDGPSHHGSVMFRRNDYLKVGGYRPEFYYGQDWDLWFRLGELGKFQMVESTLYTARIVLDSISMEAKVRQESISQLSRAAFRRRRLRLSEGHLLEAASKIRPLPLQAQSERRSRARALYFIGECLRRNGDSRALGYFNESTRQDPLLLKTWLRIGQIKLLPSGRSANGSGQTGQTQLPLDL